MMVTVPKMAMAIKKTIVIIWAHIKMIRRTSENMITVHPPKMMMKMRQSAETMWRIHKTVKVAALVRVQTRCQKRSGEKNS